MAAMRRPSTLSLLGLLAFALSAALALGPLGGVPHVPDEIVYLIQAKIFATGHRVGALPDPEVCWRFPFLLPGPTAAFPPGWPALLAPGAALGLASLVNPLLAAFIPYLTFEITTLLGGDERAGRLAATASALSPGLLALAASQMAHTSTLVAMLVVTRAALTGAPGWGAGLALGYMALARPFDALFGAVPVLLLAWRAPPRCWLRVALPAVLGGALLLADNAALTGDPLQHPATVWLEQNSPDRPACNRLGFGDEVGCTPTAGSWGHSPGKALRAAWTRAKLFDRLMLGVSGGGLLCLGGLALLARRRPAILLPVLAIPAFHLLYWSPGLAYGPRFWHMLYAFAPAALGLLLSRLSGALPWLLLAGLPALSLPVLAMDLGSSYFGVSPALKEGLERRGIQRGVIFVKGVGERRCAWPTFDIVFECSGVTGEGAGWAIFDPRPDAPLKIRNLASRPDRAATWLERYAPGEPAWVAVYYAPTDAWALAPVDPTTGMMGSPSPL